MAGTYPIKEAQIMVVDASHVVGNKDAVEIAGKVSAKDGVEKNDTDAGTIEKV